MATLRKAMHKSIGMPLPRWALIVGAILIRTQPELVLKSRWVLPERLTQAGFKFKYEQLNEALKELI